jgi:hypothetical protein
MLVQVQAQTGAKTMFIEVINDDVSFLERQYADAAALNPDYAGRSSQHSVRCVALCCVMLRCVTLRCVTLLCCSRLCEVLRPVVLCSVLDVLCL